MPRPGNVLMIYPRFSAGTFWNFAATCEVFGARYPAPPLGLITVAALLPSEWSIRLVDRNVEELTDGDLEWADLVMTGGMLPQQYDLVHVIDLCRAIGKPIVIGGPAVTSSPQLYARALLKFDKYLHIGVQFSRGCPFTCEFCDIIELYGRVPRAKTNAQMLKELDALYALGYRGHVDFVDDNFIGNKKAVKNFLLDLRTWLDQHDYPFEFTTEASINLADDAELLKRMNEANFVGVFVGIESPDPDTLVMTRKKQNTRRSLVESIQKIYAAGFFVTAGFIVGFDSEKGSVADGIVALIEDAAIPVCTVGLLFALPHTQLSRRLAREGRLHPELERYPAGSADQCTQGLNFETLRPRAEILLDLQRILERIYKPVAYAGRLQRLATMLDNSDRKQRTRAADARRRFSSTEMMHRIIHNLPEPRDLFARTLTQCISSNPRSARWIVALLVLYLHLGPFSRYVIQQIEEKIRDIETDAVDPRGTAVQATALLA